MEVLLAEIKKWMPVNVGTANTPGQCVKIDPDAVFSATSG